MTLTISEVEARWIRCPIPEERQHVSDFGRLETFDMALVRIRTEDGLEGFGEAKGAVGSAGECASLVTCVERELGPRLVGRDGREITRAWETLYNGTRDHYARARGRGFPALGRRGTTVAALGAIDVALHDLVGKALGVPVVQLLGGSCRDRMPAYASGGWADADGIGPQLESYTQQGFAAVKMRVGAMDNTVDVSVERVREARAHLGRDIDIMVDSHGTFSVAEAKRFAREVEDCGLRWFEEPLNADDRAGLAELRAATSIPIAAGESEFTRFDFLELLPGGSSRCVAARHRDRRRNHRGSADRGACERFSAGACAAPLGFGAVVRGGSARRFRLPRRRHPRVLARRQPPPPRPGGGGSAPDRWDLRGS